MMVKTIGYERGKSIGRSYKSANKVWMRTDDKRGYSSLKDYHLDALFHFGSDFEVKSYEWKDHYSVMAKRICGANRKELDVSMNKEHE
jgi:hypothetical protein